MSGQVQDKSKLDQLVDQFSALYKPAYRAYHKRAIACIGADKWSELAEKATEEGIDPGRYFSHLVEREMKHYNRAKREK